MLVNHTMKTGWFQLAIVIAATAISFYYIKQAFEKPFVEFQKINEVRAAEIRTADQ
ncbi:MAG: hypothetical protein PHW95_02115 [Patescibacteria group bacterium]|nr:hypothetical protein [Patescibacteria group bacterium]